MRKPWPAAVAIFFQTMGWACQLLAVYTTMLAFHIHVPLPAAGLVLVLMNVATIFPLWPGNVGLVQAAVALPLVRYGVPYARGFAFGIGLQAIEASVGVGSAHLPRARGRVVRDAEGDAERHGRGVEESSSRRRRRRLRPSGENVRVLASRLASRASSPPSRLRRCSRPVLHRVEGVAVVECPVADGGEGTAEVLHRAHGGEWRTAVVADPLGRPGGRALAPAPDRTAVVESAEAIGLGRLAEGELDPLVATEPRPRRAHARDTRSAA
jgi:hypothetical protein